MPSLSDCLAVCHVSAFVTCSSTALPFTNQALPRCYQSSFPCLLWKRFPAYLLSRPGTSFLRSLFSRTNIRLIRCSCPSYTQSHHHGQPRCFFRHDRRRQGELKKCRRGCKGWQLNASPTTLVSPIPSSAPYFCQCSTKAGSSCVFETSLFLYTLTLPPFSHRRHT